MSGRCVIVKHVPRCHSDSDSEAQRALETVQRAADNIIRQKDEIIEWSVPVLTAAAVFVINRDA